MWADKRPEIAHLSWCLDGDTVVLLDIESGQYHAMDPGTSRRFLDYAKGACDPELHGELRRAGLIRYIARPPRAIAPITVPGDLPMAVKTLLSARLSLSGQRFAATLRWAFSHRPRARLSDPVSSFRRAESLLPNRQGDVDCLPRALGLFAFLRHASRHPQFVIGIKRFPFTAHAWVELDGTPVLEDDRQERLATFRQILRVT